MRAAFACLIAAGFALAITACAGASTQSRAGKHGSAGAERRESAHRNVVVQTRQSAESRASSQSLQSAQSRSSDAARQRAEPAARGEVARDARAMRSSHRNDDDANRLDTTFAVARGTLLDLNASSGNINVQGWDRNEMEFRGNSEDGDLAVSHNANVVRLESRGGRARVGEVALTVRVPRRTRVVVSSERGDVQLTDVRGDVDATLVTGDITVRGGNGRMSVSSMTGDVSIRDSEGPVRVKGITGSIRLANTRGDIDISASTSEVILREVRATSAQVQLVQGDIEFGGVVSADGRYEFNTHSGDVHLFLDDNAQGTLDVQSFTGSLHSSIPLVLLSLDGDTRGGVKGFTSNQSSRSRLTSIRNLQRLQFGKVGGDGAHITVSTFNGDVHIDRGSAAIPPRNN